MLSYLFSALSLVLWVLAIPMLIGILFNFILPRHRRTVGITYILGFLVYIAVFEVIAIPCMLRITYNAFSRCRKIFLAAALLLAISGIVRLIWLLKNRQMHYLSVFPGEARPEIRDFLNPRANPDLFKADHSKESLIYWSIFFVIMAFQMVMAVVMSSFDGDDAYYVVESLLAQQADAMNTILPYTGMSTSLDIRHALAVITMWIAFIAKESNIHATILSHTIIPLFIIPFVYLVYAQVGRILFRSRQRIIPIFMIIVSFLMMFGNLSIYTPATFFLMRTWQGKAMVANLVFPMIFWVFMWMLEDVRFLKDGYSFESAYPRYVSMSSKRIHACPWIMLFFINMFSGVCSSLGIIFGSGLIALLTVILIIMSKDLKHLFGMVLCVVPNLVYLGIYYSLF